MHDTTLALTVVVVLVAGLVAAVVAWARGVARRRASDREVRALIAERDALAARLRDTRHEQVAAEPQSIVGRTGEHAVVRLPPPAGS